MTAPEWLSMRGGGLANGLSDRTQLVTIDGHPLYRLDVLPAKGKFTCAIVQSNNGKRLDGGIEYATNDAALAGGLDELRERMGW
jgi:hypothetical protein